MSRGSETSFTGLRDGSPKTLEHWQELNDILQAAHFPEWKDNVEFYAGALAGEAGELCGETFKAVRKNGKISKERLKDELGDVLVFALCLASAAGVNAGTCLYEAFSRKVLPRVRDGYYDSSDTLDDTNPAQVKAKGCTLRYVRMSDSCIDIWVEDFHSTAHEPFLLFLSSGDYEKLYQSLRKLKSAREAYGLVSDASAKTLAYLPSKLRVFRSPGLTDFEIKLPDYGSTNAVHSATICRFFETETGEKIR